MYVLYALAAIGLLAAGRWSFYGLDALQEAFGRWHQRRKLVAFDNDRLRKTERELDALRNFCWGLGYRGDEPIEKWIAQRFDSYGATIRSLEGIKRIVPDRSPHDHLRDSFRAHVAKQDDKDRPS